MFASIHKLNYYFYFFSTLVPPEFMRYPSLITSFFDYYGSFIFVTYMAAVTILDLLTARGTLFLLPQFVPL